MDTGQNFGSGDVSHFSSSTTVLRGVPQNTILGPSLLSFYTNDQPNLLSNLLTVYVMIYNLSRLILTALEIRLIHGSLASILVSIICSILANRITTSSIFSRNIVF